MSDNTFVQFLVCLGWELWHLPCAAEYCKIIISEQFVTTMQFAVAQRV